MNNDVPANVMFAFPKPSKNDSGKSGDHSSNSRIVSKTAFCLKENIIMFKLQMR